MLSIGQRGFGSRERAAGEHRPAQHAVRDRLGHDGQFSAGEHSDLATLQRRCGERAFRWQTPHISGHR